MIRRLLVPVDGSDSAVRAATFAADLAKAGKLEATLFHVYDRGGLTALGLEALSAEEAEEEKLRLAGAVFDRAAEAFAERGIAAERRVVVGLAAEEICAFAEAGKFDAIVMGTRGTSGLHGLFAGSVSERVLHRAACPVTIVR